MSYRHPDRIAPTTGSLQVSGCDVRSWDEVFAINSLMLWLRYSILPLLHVQELPANEPPWRHTVETRLKAYRLQRCVLPGQHQPVTQQAQPVADGLLGGHPRQFRKVVALG
jgi:hypothetical protein